MLGVKKGNRKSIEIPTIPNDGGRKMRCPPENPGNIKMTFLFIFLTNTEPVFVNLLRIP